jgi:hypothetical protein
VAPRRGGSSSSTLRSLSSVMRSLRIAFQPKMPRRRLGPSGIRASPRRARPLGGPGCGYPPDRRRR